MEGDARDLCLSLEYLLRDSSVDTNFLNQLISTMSPSLIDFRMMKNFILRNLQDDFLSNASNPEHLLEILEVLEEILRRESESETSSNPITPAMKSVYCGVAVDCTLRFIEADKYNPAYRKTVERIWRDRVRYMETSSSSAGGSLLFSPDLERWKAEIETSLLDPLVVEKLATMPNTRRDAFKKIKLCLTEAWGNLGPTLLQTTFQLHNKELQQHKGSSVEVQKNNEKLKGKRIMTAVEEIDLSASCSKASYVLINEGPNTTAAEEIDPPPACSKVNYVLINEVRNTTAAQEIDPPPTCSNVNYVLIDPSATCSKVNYALINMVPPDFAIEDMNQEPQTENQRSEANVANPQACHGINMSEANLTRTTTVHQNDVYNSSMLEPNRATRTHEGGTSNKRSRNNLPNRERRNPPSVKNFDPTKIRKRRKPKRWSKSEVETLRAAVTKHGIGNWKVILNLYTFGTRTEVAFHCNYI
ncbi:uncharacterized protein [Cicer arietinum]|uniref:uncharacterized protein isoform X2 n=1 Tax=Cicer arietinum TaxID=3827 RepID=UPI003CC56D09